MEPLDLSSRPPRKPRELLGDLELLMIARTVDKLRASLPGGNLGPYKIAGFSARLLEKLEIDENELRDAVAQAQTEDDVAAWLREHTDPQTYLDINLSFEKRTVGHAVNADPTFAERYPITKKLPPETPLIDMLVADDDEMFAKR
jgi:uncharacterized protein DUF5069